MAKKRKKFWVGSHICNYVKVARTKPRPEDWSPELEEWNIANIATIVCREDAEALFGGPLPGQGSKKLIPVHITITPAKAKGRKNAKRNR